MYYFSNFGLLDLTGIDLPGEAGTIMHQVENIGLVELATISFGQSFQVTPVQMAVTVSSIINGGRRVTPHFGKAVLDREGNVLETLSYEERSGVVSEKTSKTMQTLLEGVVANGPGKMHISKDIPSAERQPPLRHCREVRISTFLPLSDLHRQRIRRYWEWW